MADLWIAPQLQSRIKHSVKCWSGRPGADFNFESHSASWAQGDHWSTLAGAKGTQRPSGRQIFLAHMFPFDCWRCCNMMTQGLMPPAPYNERQWKSNIRTLSLSLPFFLSFCPTAHIPDWQFYPSPSFPICLLPCALSSSILPLPFLSRLLSPMLWLWRGGGDSGVE